MLKRRNRPKARSPLINIISDSSLEIESFVQEVDVAKISLTNPVKITFDALGEENFTGKVIYIEPAETIVDEQLILKLKLV